MRYQKSSGSHIMVDLETLGTRPGSVIVSIGACRVTKGEPADPFYCVIDVGSSKEAGFTVDEDTQRWWDRQSIEARSIFSDPNAVTAVKGLSDFADYLRQFGSASVQLWGNGSDFDNVLLIAAYNILGSPAPWKFYNNRCFRTMKQMFGDGLQFPERQGTHHNALDDAMHQARMLSMIMAKIKG